MPKTPAKSTTPRKKTDSLGRLRSRAEVAEFFGVTASAVAAWRRDGCPKDSNGFRLQDVAQWLLSRRSLKAMASPTPEVEADDAMLTVGATSPELERLRTARADLAVLELRRKRGELCDVEVAKSVNLWLARQFTMLLNRVVPIHKMDAYNALSDDWNAGLDSIEQEVLRQFDVVQLEAAGFYYTEEQVAQARSTSDEPAK